MTIYKDLVQEDLTIESASSIQGQVHGCVTVKKSANLQIHGVIVGEIIIEEGAEVFLHGAITGNIINSGSFYIFGTINGSVKTSGTGENIVSTKAVIIGDCNEDK